MSPTDPDPDRIAFTDARAFKDDLQALAERHPAWFERHFGRRPCYAIPSKALPPLDRVWGRSDGKAERDFADLCRRRSVIGFGQDSPLKFELLTRTPLDLTVVSSVWNNLPTSQRLSLEQTALETASINRRILGVVGRRRTAPANVAAFDGLAKLCEPLPKPEWPSLPWKRSMPHEQKPVGGGPATAVRAVHADAVDGFLDRWGLVELVDRHLPCPQGPWFGSELPPGSPAEPRHGVRVILPYHYPLQHDDRLLDKVRRLQGAEATGRSVPAGLAGVTHYEHYAQMARLVHLEAAVRSRYPDEFPRGAVGVMEEAMTCELGISIDSVQRLRKWVSCCKAGGRHTIQALQE